MTEKLRLKVDIKLLTVCASCLLENPSHPPRPKPYPESGTGYTFNRVYLFPNNRFRFAAGSLARRKSGKTLQDLLPKISIFLPHPPTDRQWKSWENNSCNCSVLYLPIQRGNVNKNHGLLLPWLIPLTKVALDSFLLLPFPLFHLQQVRFPVFLDNVVAFEVSENRTALSSSSAFFCCFEWKHCFQTEKHTSIPFTHSPGSFSRNRTASCALHFMVGTIPFGFGFGTLTRPRGRHFPVPKTHEIILSEPVLPSFLGSGLWMEEKRSGNDFLRRKMFYA